MNYDQHAILKHLDSPMRILAFSMDELVGYVAPFFIGAMVDDMLIIPVVGLLLVFFTRKCLGKLPRYYLIRFLYWNLPTKTYNKTLKTNLISSDKRMWINR